jgi:glyoxylase-like metal-dependent hydrolase (beta-lactamase superfamily II)
MSARSSPTRIDRVEGEVMFVNSYLVHGPNGVVLIDGMLTVSDAKKVRTTLDAADRPLAGVVITHAHPDHYAGLTQILNRADVPVIATENVDAAIRRDDAIKNDIVGPMMGAEWPTERMFPTKTVATNAVVELGGLELRVEDVGPGESPADSLWFLDDSIVFCGDLVYSNAHSYLADGSYRQWLATLARLEQSLASDVTLYVGHGEPGGASLLVDQQAYIKAFVAVVTDHRDSDESTRAAAVISRMREFVPNDRLQFLMELSIAPMLATLTS